MRNKTAPQRDASARKRARVVSASPQRHALSSDSPLEATPQGVAASPANQVALTVPAYVSKLQTLLRRRVHRAGGGCPVARG